MKEIKLTQGKVALVEDEDFEYLNQWKWFAQKSRNTYYAKRSIYDPVSRKQTGIKMHRQILGLTDPKIVCDHINHDGLCNIRRNLRACTPAQNRANSMPCKNSTSKYLGVYLHKSKYKGRVYIKWVAQISKDNKIVNLGRFHNENEAALAYNKAALIFRGEFANLNKISHG